MTGTRSTYTIRNADVVVQYADDPRAVMVGFLPSGTIKAVIIDAHGGGWIAQTNLNTWKHEPDNEILEKSGMDVYMAAGIAVYWIEYPYGWQTTGTSRYFPSSRFPQIPRAIGRCVQFLKTHATDGLATGSTARTLPTSQNAYALKGNSAGSIMSLLVGMQPDGWLDYDPSGRKTTLDRFAYAASHRVGCVFAYDCATDLRRYQGSSAAIPYFGPSSRFYQSSVPSSVVAGVSTYSKFGQVPSDIKYAASPISAAEARHDANLDLSVMVSNAISLGESSFQNSGILFALDPGDITGTVPSPGAAISAADGATGTVRLVQEDANGAQVFHIDAGSGGSDIKANWGGVLTWSGGSSDLTGVTVYGNDTYRTFRTAAQALTAWDADDLPFDTSSEHHVNYVPAFKREREAHFAANPTATSYDRWYVGNQYTFNISSAQGFDGPAFGFTTALDNIAIEQEMFEERGIVF